jgi:AraC-like DNA-binding protein
LDEADISDWSPIAVERSALRIHARWMLGLSPSPSARTRCRPPVALARLVRDAHLLDDVPAETMRAEAFPDGSVSLLLRVRRDGAADLSVAGPRTRALFKLVPEAKLAVLVAFWPGAIHALLGGVPLSELADRYVLLDELWGSSTQPLLEGLASAGNAAAAWARLCRELSRRAARTEESRASILARRAVVRLTRDPPTTVRAVANELGVTPRHLRRVFRTAVGVGPKDFTRMLRLQRALAAAATLRRWSDVAAEAGYCDQPHLIAEFRDLVGMTPGEFIRRSAAVGSPRG